MEESQGNIQKNNFTVYEKIEVDDINQGQSVTANWPRVLRLNLRKYFYQ